MRMCAAAILPPAVLLASASCTRTGEGCCKQSGRVAGAEAVQPPQRRREGQIGGGAALPEKGKDVACLSKVTAP